MSGGAFSGRLVAAVIAVGVFAFAAFFVLSAYAPDLRSGRDGGAHALSESAVGFAGLARLLELKGETVEVSRTERASLDAGLIILTPSLETNPDDILRRVRGQGPPVLIVLPKWRTEPARRRIGWVQSSGVLPSPPFTRWSSGWLGGRGFGVVTLSKREDAVLLAASVPGGAATPAGRIDQLQVLTNLSSDVVEPRLSTPRGIVLGRARRFSGRTVFILSDPDILNTQGLAELATARAALVVLADSRAGSGPIVFDVSLNGFESGRSLLKLALSPPFLAVTLCALAAAALAGWQAAVRFGPRARAGRAVALGAEALTENAAGLIRLSGREHRMAERYAELVQTRAARAVAAPAAGSAAYLDGLGRSRPGLARWSELRNEAEAVRKRDALVGLARRMHEWKREVTRG